MISRRVFLSVALAGIAVVAAGSVPWPAGGLALRADLVRELEALIGDRLTSEDSTITIFPTPRIDFTGVRIGGEADAVARAEAVSVRLALWPLLGGQAQAHRVDVRTPRIIWNEASQPHDLWLLARQYIASIDASARAGAIHPPDRLTIADGAVVARKGGRVLLRRVNANMVWPSINRQLDINASALWRGEPVDLRIEKLHPASLAAGLASPVVLRLSAQPVSFSFAGRVGADDPPSLDGLVNFRSRSLARVTEWLHTPLTFARSAGRMVIKSSARLTHEGLSMPDARIEIDGGTFEGALTARHNDAGRILISATLDAALLDFNTILAPLTPRTGAAATSPILPAQTGSGPANDMDVRLSISRALIGPLDVQDAAAAILVSNGRMEFALNQAQLENGSIRGRLLVETAQRDITARLAASFDGIDAQKTLHRLFGSALFSGEASGSVALTADGQSARQLAANLNGTVSARINNGALLGVDLEDIVERSRHSPLATALDWLGGRTPFSEADATVTVTGGIGVVAGALKAGAITGRIAGNVGIADRALDLRAAVRRAAGETGEGHAATPDQADAIGFPIEISGTWDYPIVTPDIRALIDRSGVAGQPASAP